MPNRFPKDKTIVQLIAVLPGGPKRACLARMLYQLELLASLAANEDGHATLEAQLEAETANALALCADGYLTGLKNGRLASNTKD